MSTIPTSRAEAKRLKAPTYITGKPCPHGHAAPRLTSSCYCTACNLRDGYKWNRENPERRLNFARKHHKLPDPIRANPGICESCGGKTRRSICLDHDHLTGTFRGWLCGKCNSGIGLLGDNIEGVRRALEYLQRVT